MVPRRDRVPQAGPYQPVEKVHPGCVRPLWPNYCVALPPRIPRFDAVVRLVFGHNDSASPAERLYQQTVIASPSILQKHGQTRDAPNVLRTPLDRSSPPGRTACKNGLAHPHHSGALGSGCHRVQRAGVRFPVGRAAHGFDVPLLSPHAIRAPGKSYPDCTPGRTADNSLEPDSPAHRRPRRRLSQPIRQPTSARSVSRLFFAAS